MDRPAECAWGPTSRGGGVYYNVFVGEGLRLLDDQASVKATTRNTDAGSGANAV